MAQKSTFVTFILSWIPGLGHLYLGLNKRGLQFMIGFFVCIMFIPVLPTVFPFAVAVLWFYSLFDALQKVALVNRYLAGNSTEQLGNQVTHEESTEIAKLDAGINPMQILGEKNSIDPLWIGTLCVIVGILVLIRQVFPMVWDILIRIHFGSILLACVLIGFGIWLILAQRAKKS